MVSQNETFKGLRIVLDGGTYINCRFRGCVLLYHATLPVIMDGCIFEECTWSLGGPAQAMVQFMAGLYQAGAKELIDNTFESIRGNTPKPVYDS